MGFLTPAAPRQTERREPRFTLPAVPKSADTARPRPNMVGTRTGIPYAAGDYGSAEMADWFPWLGSPDLEINIWRDRIVARIRDLVRNDGWASAGVTHLLDTIIGGNLRLIAKPDFRHLARHYGPGFNADWADAFAQAAQDQWRIYSEDIGRWCDGARKSTVSQLFRLAFRHKLVDGEALAVILWRTTDVGYGRADYRTALQLIDPDRLSNPALMFDTRQMRDGVEIDAFGAPAAYHIRRAHQGDWFNAPLAWQWDRVPRETAEGRPVVLHDYDPDRTGQHRALGIFAPVLARMKMLADYDRIEMQAAVVNASLAAFVESPYDPNDVQDALDSELGGADRSGELRAYQNGREDFHRHRRLRVANADIKTLYPGEKISTIASTHPGGNFENFESAMLRNCAAAIGTTVMDLSQNWKDVNYSSARAAMMSIWKTMDRRRADFTRGFCTPFYSAFLEEAFDRGNLPLPPGAPDFVEERTAYSGCRWMGPGRGWIDPVKEAQAAVLRMDAGITTLVQECADQGLDVEDVMAERAMIIKHLQKHGLPLPGWAVEPGMMADKKPKPQ